MGFKVEKHTEINSEGRLCTMLINSEIKLLVVEDNLLSAILKL